MSLSTWLKSVRLHWLSRPAHWAEVMAEADTLQCEFDGAAAAVAHQSAERTRSARERRLLGDVEAELRRRSAAS